MAEQTKEKKDTAQTSQIDNFLMFQKLMGEHIKQKMSLDPYLKGASSALKKMGEKDIAESAMQIGSDKTAEQFNNMIMRGIGVPNQQEQPQQGTEQLSQLIQPQQAQQQQKQQGFNTINMLEQLINLGGLIKPSAQDQLALAQTQAIQQKIVGQEPLQAGEREKIGLETQKAIMTEMIKLDKEGRLKPQDLFTGYENASKAFILSRDAHARVEAAAKDPSAAGDLALIFNYMKVLDPGSTVREGEFATAQNSVGVPARWRATYNNVLSGKRLAPSQRTDFLDRSRRLFKSIEEQQGKTTKEFRDIAKRNNLDPDMIFRDVGLKQTQPGTTNVTKSGVSWRKK